MNDPAFRELGQNTPAPNDAPRPADSTSTDQPVPQFGLLDVIEAFTAMRHEFRTQTRENRPLVESVTAASETLRRIESTIDQKLESVAADAGLQSLLEIIIDLDIGLQRAVSVTSAQLDQSSDQRMELVNSVRRLFNQSGLIARWFARRFYGNVVETIEANNPSRTDSTADGIRMLLVRLRRMMSESGVERCETLGKPFDAETMQAISSIATEDVSPGCVAEEVSPAYFYRGRLVRFAEVRVAKVESSKEPKYEQ